MNAKAIKFPVFVNGKKLIAQAEEVNNPVQHVYRILFSDGYSDEFLLDEDTGRLYADKKEESLPYSKALTNDFEILIVVKPNKFYHVFQEEIDGVKTNVWVIQGERQGRITYKVYYNSFYRFELQKLNDSWNVSDYSEANSKDIDPDLAKKVERLLYSVV